MYEDDLSEMWASTTVIYELPIFGSQFLKAYGIENCGVLTKTFFAPAGLSASLYKRAARHAKN